MNADKTTFDALETASLLDYTALVETLRRTVVEYGAGNIVSPERLSIPLRGGVMLSMPSSAEDIAIHKLVNVCPGNTARNLPTINGQVIACDPVTGEMLFVLDGPTVTGRRTAAVSALAAMTLLNGSPKEILVIGTGKQASNHVEAFATLFPDARILAKGVSDDSTRRFVERQKEVAPRLEALQGDIPKSVDVVVTVTTSKKPVYNEAVRAGRLVIGVGAFTPDAVEISKEVVDGSFVVVDDPVGAKHEAGDLIQAGFDWNRAGSLAQAIQGQLSPDVPIFFKSVGCAAWDLAACRVARNAPG
ncbi:1-piperideine-2-carboxylate/1-pyrroline-2-carboxylate reductase [NAD(P)H] [Caballeronia udeis]|jgi:1-piperideine-2-carboxylate/1-pyrroline-2-carboxylate reductase [NAD(P)H]|uniref:1-piperideine-2-carboxylate/1-pyrroline-2-carboxylate reductase [NAD(P)H] n=1 Tax=Caballeronia udeis TaxID=1232866 RepID=A0ABW8MHD8_9BURK